MARFETAFDAAGIDPTTAYDLLPAGRYRVQIVESELRVTRAGTGQYLWLMLDIIDGPLTGRKLFEQLNLINPNPTTVEIAQRTLSAICHATGQLQVTDSEQLHFKPMTIVVTVDAGKNGAPERNKIRYVVPNEDKSAPKPAPTAAPQRPPTAPWGRKA